MNENSKKAKVYFGKTTILHVHHAFMYISLPSLHDYEMKMPNFTFCGGRVSRFIYISLPSLHDYEVKIPNFTFCGGRASRFYVLFFAIIARLRGENT